MRFGLSVCLSVVKLCLVFFTDGVLLLYRGEKTESGVWILSV